MFALLSEFIPIISPINIGLIINSQVGCPTNQARGAPLPSGHPNTTLSKNMACVAKAEPYYFFLHIQVNQSSSVYERTSGQHEMREMLFRNDRVRNLNAESLSKVSHSRRGKVFGFRVIVSPRALKVCQVAGPAISTPLSFRTVMRALFQ